MSSDNLQETQQENRILDDGEVIQLQDSRPGIDTSNIEFEVADDGEWLLTITSEGKTRTFPLGTPEELIAKIEKAREKLFKKFEQAIEHHENMADRAKRKMRRVRGGVGHSGDVVEEWKEKFERRQEKIAEIKKAMEQLEVVFSWFIKRLKGKEITADDVPGNPDPDEFTPLSDELFAFLMLPWALMFGGAERMPDLPEEWKDQIGTGE